MSEKPLKVQIEERLQTEDLTLPVCPRIQQQLARAFSDRQDINPLKKLILQDPALVGRILQVANGPFFAGLSQVQLLDHAMVRLGLKKTLQLIEELVETVDKPDTNPLVAQYLPRLWLRSHLSALGCHWLAKRVGHHQIAAEAYIAGLLHDVGKLLILQVLDELQRQKENTVQLSAPLIDEILLNMHGSQGAALLKSWNLPETYLKVAEQHHADQVDQQEVLLVIVRLVDLACIKAGVGVAPEPSISLAATPEAQTLGLSEIQLAELEIYLEDHVVHSSEHC